MRTIIICAAVLLLAALAVAQQAPVVLNYGPAYGPCLACGPFIPVVTTPSISLQSVMTSPVGASNATGGMVAGAENATVFMVPAYSGTTYTQPVWYGAPLPLMILPRTEALAKFRTGAVHPSRGRVSFFPAFEETASVAQAAAAAKNAPHAARTYTNQDIDRLKK
jgi:hypothetical protein